MTLEYLSPSHPMPVPTRPSDWSSSARTSPDAPTLSVPSATSLALSCEFSLSNSRFSKSSSVTKSTSSPLAWTCYSWIAPQKPCYITFMILNEIFQVAWDFPNCTNPLFGHIIKTVFAAVYGGQLYGLFNLMGLASSGGLFGLVSLISLASFKKMRG